MSEGSVEFRMAFTSFERAIIDWFINHSTHPAVANQLRSASLASREYTGAGLYLNITVAAQDRIPPSVASPINGPEIRSIEIENGAGSLLFHNDGTIEFVEVFTYTAELLGEPATYSFQERDSLTR
jgi:hypothetical protein